jgi:hypothetical protein
MVKGRYSFPSIRFVKQMPVAYVGTLNDERMSFAQWLNDHSIKLVGVPAHPPILYTGEFVNATHACGTWVIEARAVRLDERRVAKFPGATGRWDLHAA